MWPKAAMNKKTLSERDICTKFITPALVKAGWDVETQIREERRFHLRVENCGRAGHKCG